MNRQWKRRAHRRRRSEDERQTAGQPHHFKQDTRLLSVSARKERHRGVQGRWQRQGGQRDAELERGVRLQCASPAHSREDGAADERTNGQAAHERGQHGASRSGGVTELEGEPPGPDHLVDQSGRARARVENDEGVSPWHDARRRFVSCCLCRSAAIVESWRQERAVCAGSLEGMPTKDGLWRPHQRAAGRGHGTEASQRVSGKRPRPTCTTPGCA